eukprot:CAMPEP_0201548546 /NCGR_PEP_ID=MMETSP0173_2-20130828/5094_1 /ASSEMBLY_ACC=CAM_ASM_000268 /TAXON_ID=218659 /ORGANISM="Vexillifera sp., Strain DIVA3 564/2" /LENGTH=279 /DNA_ID=CAMNT_0047957967 /DNA_START=76 /DNA_END=915 /DNA_ORIENTATION=+
MAEAIIRGICAGNVVEPKSVFVFNPTVARREFLSKKYAIQGAPSNEFLFENTDIIFLCVKPQMVPQVLGKLDLSKLISRECLLISVCAGLTIQRTIDAFEALPNPSTLLSMVRVMPNTPFLIGEGAAGYVVGVPGTSHALIGQVAESHLTLTKKMLDACAKVVVQMDKEEALHGITAISGSGTAYVLRFIEALAQGGCALGIPDKDALPLAIQTVLGAAKMAQNRSTTLKDVQTLRENVTSKGGTTAAALDELKRNEFLEIVVKAMQACSNRSIELSKM